MTRIMLFPGQGSQFVGMGKDLADSFRPAAELFQEIDDALSQHLSRLIFEGPEDELRLTENAQPALMAVSMAIIRTLESDGKPVASLASHVAGHSLGEYTALCAAKALSVTDTARLLKLRGKAMQKAVPVGEGAMAAILGLECAVVEEIAKEASSDIHLCELANDNAPGQAVVSGHKDAVERAIALAKEKGARRGLLLPVSAPFHCSLMGPAADAMKTALDGAALARPLVPVIANVTAAPVSDPETVRRLLVEQVTGRVRWRESVAEFTGLGINQAVEVGAGKVLSGLVRRIDRELAVSNLESPADVEAFSASI